MCSHTNWIMYIEKFEYMLSHFGSQNSQSNLERPNCPEPQPCSRTHPFAGLRECTHPWVFSETRGVTRMLISTPQAMANLV